ncbi:MAG: leucine-rich repeat protein [Catenibacterium mitsuokai]|nr:leucine-rich repeat protein [Catenibacterium mitsuokai]MCI6075950.1 leucine-rich repeat protein [Catenibacterium mitsuokai]
MLKKLSIILIVYLMMITGASINVGALDSNGFTYTLDNDEATITYYECNEDIDTLRVPDQIDGHKVTKISMNFATYMHKINSLVLPNTINDILVPDSNSNYMFYGIDSIKFEGINNNFYIDNGCVYSKDKSILYFIPSGLSSLKLPNETKSVNFGNLKNTHLTSLNIPGNVEKIYSYSLYLPDSLESLNINTNINISIVSNNLASLNYGDNVTDLSYIGISCKNLSELNFSDSLVKMPSSIYSNKLKQLNIPKNVDKFVDLLNLNNLEEFIVDSANKNFKSVNGVLFSGDTLIKYPKNSQLEHFEVPEGTKKINELGNSNLKSVKLPNSLEEINSEAMDRCINIETINIPQNLEGDLDVLLCNCNKIKNLTLDPNNKNYVIADGGIYSKDYKTLYKYLDYNEKTPLINDKTTKIGRDAFDSKESIESINLKNITKIAYGAFNECTKLNDISLDNVNKLGNYAFRKCISLKNVKLSENLETSTLWGTFFGCTNLESINIPSRVTDLGENSYSLFVFSDCNKLTNLTVSKDNNNYVVKDNALYTQNYGTLVKQLDKSITSFDAKEGTTIIRSQAFLDCKKLKSVNLNNVNEIDVSAFEGCDNLKYVVIPKTVTEVTLDGNKDISCKLYVYSDSEALKSIEQWNSHEWNKHIDYTVINSFADNSSSIKVDLLTQNSGASLKVEQITSGNSYDEVAKYSDNFNLYDISFYKDNEKVTIDGTAIVKIPVKEGMDGNKCKVYYNDDGQFTDMNAVYKDGYMEFETTHFSEYVLVEGSLPTLTMGDVNGDGKVNVLDAVMVLRHDANIIKLNDSQLKAADVNEDGKVDVLDAVMILRYEAGIIKSFKS